MEVNRHQLLEVLQRHVGAEEGIGVEQLALALACTERAIRKLVTELREEGVAVCGHPSRGYFIAATAAELEETCAFLRHRAMTSLALEAKLRKVPLPDLLGQLRLPS